MGENEKNQKRLEYLIDEAFDDLEIDEIIDEKNIEFSEEHNKKIEKLFKREKNKRIVKEAKSVFMKIAVIVIVVVLGMTFCVEANRIKFFNFIVDYTNKYTEIRYNENDINTNKNIETENNEENMIELGYIPPNFSLNRKQIKETSIYMAFTNDKKNFVISAKEQEGVVQIDTENAEVESININGRNCMMVTKDERISVYWTTNNMSFFIGGNIDKEEIIKIIENIK